MPTPIDGNMATANIRTGSVVLPSVMYIVWWNTAFSAIAPAIIPKVIVRGLWVAVTLKIVNSAATIAAINDFICRTVWTQLPLSASGFVPQLV